MDIIKEIIGDDIYYIIEEYLKQQKMDIKLIKDEEEKTIDIPKGHNLKWWYLRGYKCENLIDTLLIFSNIEIGTVIENINRYLDYFDFLVYCVLKKMYRTALGDGTHAICTGGDMYRIRKPEIYLEDAIETINKSDNIIIFLILIIKNSPCGPNTPFVIKLIHDNDPNCLKRHEDQILNCKEKITNYNWLMWCDILISDYKKFVLGDQIDYG